MVLTKHSSKLLSLFVLLSTIRECFTGAETQNNDGTSTPDPNTVQNNDSNPAAENQTPPAKPPGRFSKFAFNREKWRLRKEKLGRDEISLISMLEVPTSMYLLSFSIFSVNLFTIKPVEEPGTLKTAKIALVTLQLLMDKKIFDSCANPYGYRINHFDVRNHIFTREYIKSNPYDEKYMAIYNSFLYDCCHPLLDMYDQRLTEDQAEANKIGNLMYKFEKIPDEHSELDTTEADVEEVQPQELPPHSILKKNKDDEPSEASKQKTVTFASSEGKADSEGKVDSEGKAHSEGENTETTPPQGQAPVKKQNQMWSKTKTAAGYYSKKAAWMTAKAPFLPFYYSYVGTKRVQKGVNNQLVKRKLKKGPFQAQALTYWQKAFIYRAINWASNFLVEPRYNPSIKIKRKLTAIVDKYGVNLLDPKYENLKKTMITFDCIPIEPTDLENCCEDKDRSVEHLYHLRDVYNKQIEKEKEEKKRRKKLDLEKVEKKKRTKDETLSKAEKFRKNIKIDMLEYGFYPVEWKKQVALEVVDAFLPHKFEEFFSMKPKIARRIIKKRYKIRKYTERAQQLGFQIDHKEGTVVVVAPEIREFHGTGKDNNPHMNRPIGDGNGMPTSHLTTTDSQHPTHQEPDAENPVVEQVHSGPWWKKAFYVTINTVVGICTGESSSKKTKQSTATAEHSQDGHLPPQDSHIAA